jgi:hypothetical protein
MDIHSWVTASFWMLVGGVFFAVLILLLQWQMRRRKRTIGEVADLMRKPDYDQIEELFRPRGQDLQHLMGDLFFLRDRGARRAELELLQEQYRRLYHNSLVNKDLADTDWHDMRNDSEGEFEGLRERLGPLRNTAAECCKPLRIALALIWFWTLVHFLQLDRLKFLAIPEPAALRRLWGTDILETYQELKDAIAGMREIYGEEECQTIVARM